MSGEIKKKLNGATPWIIAGGSIPLSLLIGWSVAVGGYAKTITNNEARLAEHESRIRNVETAIVRLTEIADWWKKKCEQ